MPCYDAFAQSSIPSDDDRGSKIDEERNPIPTRAKRSTLEDAAAGHVRGNSMLFGIKAHPTYDDESSHGIDSVPPALLRSEDKEGERRKESIDDVEQQREEETMGDDFD